MFSFRCQFLLFLSFLVLIVSSDYNDLVINLNGIFELLDANSESEKEIISNIEDHRLESDWILVDESLAIKLDIYTAECRPSLGRSYVAYRSSRHEDRKFDVSCMTLKGFTATPLYLNKFRILQKLSKTLFAIQRILPNTNQTTTIDEEIAKTAIQNDIHSKMEFMDVNDWNATEIIWNYLLEKQTELKASELSFIDVAMRMTNLHEILLEDLELDKLYEMVIEELQRHRFDESPFKPRMFSNEGVESYNLPLEPRSAGSKDDIYRATIRLTNSENEKENEKKKEKENENDAQFSSILLAYKTKYETALGLLFTTLILIAVLGCIYFFKQRKNQGFNLRRNSRHHSFSAEDKEQESLNVLNVTHSGLSSHRSFKDEEIPNLPPPPGTPRGSARRVSNV